MKHYEIKCLGNHPVGIICIDEDDGCLQSITIMDLSLTSRNQREKIHDYILKRNDEGTFTTPRLYVDKPHEIGY